MPVAIFGMITPRNQSEIHAPQGLAIGREYVRRFAQAHGAAGFDRILVPQGSTGPDASRVIAYAAAVTERVHVLLAHRPGFIGPAFSARQLARLENFTVGRLAVHIISGCSQLVPQGAPLRLSPGQAGAVSPRIGDIHRVSDAFDDRVSISTRMYGANIGTVRRHVFADDGSVKPFVPGHSNQWLPNL